MPKVGSKHFSYTAQGKQAAAAYAKKSGMPRAEKARDTSMKQMKKKKHGAG